MQRQRIDVETAGYEPYPALMGEAGSTAYVHHFSVIPSCLTTQVTEGVWNAVVTTPGKGTFLIRRQKDQSTQPCPLRAYEIRYIEAVSKPM